MEGINVFEKFGIRTGNETYATRMQILDLYDVPKKTLYDNIARLKEDGLINGAKIRTVAEDGKNRNVEVFTLEETIAIGLRLRSDTAIRLQRYATVLVSDRTRALEEQKRLLELELSYAWNALDRDDLYR